MNHSSRTPVIRFALMMAGAALVWCRDMSWREFILDALPLMGGIPLAFWLGSPWQRRANDEQVRFSPWLLILASLALVFGWLMPSVTLLALGWSVIAIQMMQRRYQTSANVVGLWLMLLLSFPWLVIEWPAIGWWFRLSAAYATEHFFTLMQMPIVRNGTDLQVLGENIRIEPGCAGWNLLQLTLLTGLSMGLHEIKTRKRFWCFLGWLALISWTANWMRILLLTGMCLTFGVKTADGIWHGLTGIFVLILTLLMAKWLAVLWGDHSQKKVIIRKIQ